MHCRRIGYDYHLTIIVIEHKTYVIKFAIYL